MMLLDKLFLVVVSDRDNLREFIKLMNDDLIIEEFKTLLLIRYNNRPLMKVEFSYNIGDISRHRIVIEKWFLYNNSKVVVEILDILANNFEIYVSACEIAMDTSVNYISKFNRCKKKLKFRKDVRATYFGAESSDKEKRSISCETKYIRRRGPNPKIELRIENKSKEILNNIGNDYIRDFHIDNGFKIGQAIYRVELRIDSLVALRVSSNRIWVKDGQIISDTKYRALKDAGQDIGDYEKLFRTRYLDLNFFELINNQDYLASVFFYLVEKKLIVDSKKLIHFKYKKKELTYRDIYTDVRNKEVTSCMLSPEDLIINRALEILENACYLSSIMKERFDRLSFD